MKNKILFRLGYLPLLLALPALLAAPGNSVADDQPTIVKDSIQVTLMKHNAKEGWWPSIEYKVNGPITSGSQLYVEFAVPGKPWSKFDCPTREIKSGEWWKTNCETTKWGSEKPSELSKLVGPVGFSIKLRNELQGTDVTLFTGKARLAKGPASPGDTLGEYFVDEDWRIPIGYVFFGTEYVHRDDSPLHVGFWYRGNPPDVEAHLFYQGKDVAKVVAPANGPGDWDPTKHQWGFADCEFQGVYRAELPEGQGSAPRFALSKNPGDYEVKVLVVGHLARSIKFKVDSDGKLDNGIASANKLGSDRIIAPVEVIGNQGPWDRTAWKTGAFYGNPLTGFTASR
jgi:hypothetical protein